MSENVKQPRPEKIGYLDLRAALDVTENKDLGAKGDQLFRRHLLTILVEISGSLDSLAYSYRELLKLQKEKRNGGAQ